LADSDRLPQESRWSAFWNWPCRAEGDRFEQRFIYDGQLPVLRETYRYARAETSGVKFRSRDRIDATRYFHLLNGTMAAVDSDGTTDVGRKRGQAALFRRIEVGRGCEELSLRLDGLRLAG